MVRLSQSCNLFRSPLARVGGVRRKDISDVRVFWCNWCSASVDPESSMNCPTACLITAGGIDGWAFKAPTVIGAGWIGWRAAARSV